MKRLEALEVGKAFESFKGYLGVFRAARKREAIRSVSLSISEGEVVGLAGPNGAGKTTLLKILSGVLVPTSGKVLLEGVDIFACPGSAQGHVRLAVADSRSFYWRLTLAQNLDFFAAVTGMRAAARREAVLRGARAMGLEDRLGDRFYTLSSGMMQRMALARAMLVEGDVWLLDEPTKDLDSEYREKLFSLIGQWRDRGNSVVLASHAPGDLSRLCSRVVQLRDGAVVEDETGEEVGE